MKNRKLISLIMALVMLCSIITMMPITASAADSFIEFNIAPNPCSANRSVSPLPAAGSPVEGDTYYLNLAATDDYKLDWAEFYVKAPGDTSFTCIYRHDTSRYFRWVNYAYTLSSAGYYEFRVDIATTGGAQGSIGIATNVAAKQTAPAPQKPTSTTYSAVEMNVSSIPCSANLSAAAFPEYQIPSQGDSYYLNLACTDDYKLDHAEFYVKAPGQNDFKLVYQYDPASYFRWVNYQYKFTKSGTYTIRTNVTATNGAQGSSDLSFDVAANDVYTEFAPVWPCASANYISTMYRYWNGGNPKSHGVRSNKYNAFDIAGSKGDSIYAIEGGTVVEKNYQKSGFGYYVVIEHDNGLRSLYGHLKSEAVVNKGDTVSRQQVIGYMGSTGNSSGNHLHFEMYDPDDTSAVINPWTTYYQGNVNVTVGGNSYKANSGYTNDTYAVDWCNWLKNNCTKNSSGDYVYTVGGSLCAYAEVYNPVITNLVTDVVGKIDTTENKDTETKDGSANSESDAKNDVFKIADIITGIYEPVVISGYKLSNP